MFLRATIRKKDGKEHRYFSVVENRRVGRGRVVQRHVLYLGEINDSQELGWRRSIEAFEEGVARPRPLSLFPEDRCAEMADDGSIVRLKLKQLRLLRPRTFGDCWLALGLWRELQLDRFWNARLRCSRKGTPWGQVLFVLVAYRLLAPGSEWRLHREWFDRSALADLLGSDSSLAEINTLYRCHDLLLAHKQAVFEHLVGRWRDLFNASYEVLLYDLTSTYVEAEPPFPEGDKRRHGYSRDHRPDCLQVVIALVVTPEG
ncbi:MAG: IS1634 family transposase, partial [Terriglobia bacterium]